MHASLPHWISHMVKLYWLSAPSTAQHRKTHTAAEADQEAWPDDTPSPPAADRGMQPSPTKTRREISTDAAAVTG